MIKFHDQLYAFTGDSNAERYDPVFDSWASLKSLTLSYTKRAAVVRGQIYAINVDIRAKKTTIERFDVGLRSWETVLLSDEGYRGNSCVVAAGNCLYVLGGQHLQKYGQEVATSERFDTVQNKWEEIADMQEKRECAFGVATQGKIFVAGGRGPVSKTCEVYNISTNEWQFIGSLNVPCFGEVWCVLMEHCMYWVAHGMSTPLKVMIQQRMNGPRRLPYQWTRSPKKRIVLLKAVH